MNGQFTVGLGEEGRVSSKVSRPPGGASSIFAEPEAATPTRTNNKPYRMRSNFELGDEQPDQVVVQQNRRRSKPSVNPLTGELVGDFGNSTPMVPSNTTSSPCGSAFASSASSVCSEETNSSKEGTPSPPPSVISGDRTPPPRKGRVPPGGYSSPLW